MEGLTFSTGHQGNTSELRGVAPTTPPSRPSATPPAGTNALADSAPEETPVAEPVRVEAPESSFQARLNYDEDKAELYVEILDPATGDVVQRIPAETAADRIHELTGSYGGTVVNKIA